MNALTVVIRGDNSQLQQTLTKTRQALAGLGNSMRLAFAGLAGLGAAAAGFKALRSSLVSAAEMQDFETSFATLLGGMDKAKKRLAELSKFAATTPFELQNSVKASKVLQTLTNGALATGKGLRMVGDVAASTGEPFEELAVHFGRLYAGLKSGAAVGEAMARLQELGVLTAETRQKLEAMQKSGQKGVGLWKIASNDFARFAGEMDRRSKTWNGLWSNLKDNIGAMMREFGKPLIDSLSPLLTQVVDMTQQLGPAAREAGASVAEALSIGFQAFKDGTFASLIGNLEAIALKKLGSALMRPVIGSIYAGMEIFRQSLSNVGKVAGAIFSGDLWKGICNTLVGMGQQLGASMLRALKEPILYLQTAMEWVGAKFGNALISAVTGPIAYLKAGMEYFTQGILNALRNVPGMKDVLGEKENRTFEDLHRDQQEIAKAQMGERNTASFGDMLDKNRKQDLTGRDANALERRAQDNMSRGDAQVSSALAPLNGLGQTNLDAVKTAYAAGDDTAKRKPVFDWSGDQTNLDATVAALTQRRDTARKEAEKVATGGPQKVKFKMRSDDNEDAGKSHKGGSGVITSELARVGGGGLAAGGTAGLIRESNSHLKKIVSYLARQSGLQSAAVKGSGGLRTFSLTSPA